MNEITIILGLGIVITGILAFFLGVWIGKKKERNNLGESYRDYVVKSLGDMAQDLYSNRGANVTFRTGNDPSVIEIIIDGHFTTFTVNEDEAPSQTRKLIWRKVTRCIKEQN